MLQLLNRHLELVVSLTSVLIIIAVGYLFTDADSDVWSVTVIVGLSVLLINGVVFWHVRRLQRIARQQTIAELREMLKDNVTNNLATISLNAELSKQMDDKRRKRIMTAVHRIDGILDLLSEDSLGEWQTHYANTRKRDIPPSLYQ